MQRGRGTFDRLLREIRPVEFYTPAGKYLGQRLSYNVDMARLYRITNKIGKALYWRKTKVLGSETCARSLELGDITDPQIVRIAKSLESANVPVKSIGGDIFRYKVMPADDKERCAGILLNFYGVLAFCVVILPVEAGARLP